MTLADLGCAAVGVFMAAQVRFGSNVASMYLALSLALPVLWIVALWLAGAYDVRFIDTGSDEYRKVLNAGVSLTAAVAIFSYAINLELSRAYVVIALPSITVFDLVARFAMRKRLHRHRMRGKCLHNVVAVGHELAIADLVTELDGVPFGQPALALAAQLQRRAERAGVPTVLSELDGNPEGIRLEGVPRTSGGICSVWWPGPGRRGVTPSWNCARPPGAP